MKVLVLCFALISVISAGGEPRDPRCPYYGADAEAIHFAHETDCTKFYKCDPAGHPIELQCEAGLQYHPSLQLCDWPNNYCNVDSIIEMRDNEEETTTNAPENTTEWLPEGCPADEDPKDPTHLPHPTDCNLFYKCLEGVPSLLNCPEGLHWSIEKNYCDYPENAKCVRPLPEE